jgi:hypothetical protein
MFYRLGLFLLVEPQQRKNRLYKKRIPWYNNKMDTEQKTTTIDMVNGLTEIADYMNDEELTTALTFIAKVILKPDIPLNVAQVEIVRLQAIAAKMSFKATWLTNVDKGDRAKKNIYYTAAESINNLVSALKYITR